MDTALTQKFPFILDRNLAKANCTGNHVCTSCDKVVLGYGLNVGLFRGFEFFTIRYYGYNKALKCNNAFMDFNNINTMRR